MILGEVKARPKDIISFSLDYISKSKVQTSNPSSSPTPLDTPARPADLYTDGEMESSISSIISSSSHKDCSIAQWSRGTAHGDSKRFPSAGAWICCETGRDVR